MAIYTQSVTDISSADLQELLAEKAIENVQLEFKLEIPDKDATLKKLSSSAIHSAGMSSSVRRQTATEH